jgi:hypothetical protein
VIYDDPERLKADRAAADRAYNEALTRLDAAIQKLPADFPHPPPGPDEHQIASLNVLWNVDMPEPGSGVRAQITAAVRRMVAPLFQQQRAFNSAVVDHLNRNVRVQLETQQSIATTLTMLRDEFEAAIRFQSVLVVFLQQITAYVDTRDRDVAGLLRGLSGAIDAVSGELLKRSEALVARDARREGQVDDLERAIADLQAQLAALPGRVQPRIQ